jgi:hypothetical protein
MINKFRCKRLIFNVLESLEFKWVFRSFEIMNLRDTLLAEHSKAQCMKIVKWIGNDPQRFNELLKLFLSDDFRAVQRAAWPLSYAVQAHPALIKPHYGKLIRNLRQPGLPDAVKRNTVRIFQDIDAPTRFHGELMNTCFVFIESMTEKPAIKAFALTVLFNLSELYPDIRPELKTIIEDRWNYESAAFKSRGRKILKALAS